MPRVKQIFLRKKSKQYTKQALWGMLFILPWFIGLIFFFIIPFIQTIIYTLNKISIGNNGFNFTFVGFNNYNYLFTQDPDFLVQLVSSLRDMIPQVLFIVIFSMFIAILLKDKFHGRTLARAVFFIPVVISTGVVIQVLKENILYSGDVTGHVANVKNYIFQVPTFVKLLGNLGIPENLQNILSNYVISPLFDLVLKSGVQILLMLAAVINIPSSYYEVSSIEGATEWEKFWKITFPLVTPTLMVSLIYSIIDSFTDYGNGVMRMVSNWFTKGQYEYSTTIAFVYFICVFLIIGIIYKLIAKHVVYISD